MQFPPKARISKPAEKAVARQQQLKHSTIPELSVYAHVTMEELFGEVFYTVRAECAPRVEAG
jgi:hypothetical protein